MRFFTDQDVYLVTVRFLRELNHDVVTASDLGMSRSPDQDILEQAHRSGRVFVTRDRDFSNLIFVNALSLGVIYLRITPKSITAVHAELERVLQLHDEETLRSLFVVVEPGRHRIRRSST